VSVAQALLCSQICRAAVGSSVMFSVLLVSAGHSLLTQLPGVGFRCGMRWQFTHYTQEITPGARAGMGEQHFSSIVAQVSFVLYVVRAEG